jgi:hypothetical protein
MLTGAEDPDELTHCFVLKGACLAWAMLEGAKVYGSDPLDTEPVGIRSKHIENRHVRLAPGWYGVLLGRGTKGVTREQYDDVVTKLPDMRIPRWGSKELSEGMGCVVGVVQVCHSLPHGLCKNSPWANGDPVCNIISKAGWLSEAVPCRGNLGACPIKDRPTLDRVRELASLAVKEGKVLPTGGDTKFPYRGPGVWKASRKRKKWVNGLNDVDEIPNLVQFLKKSQQRLAERAARGGSDA